MSHPSLPRLDNPGGQVEFLGNESRGRPNKAFGARILARVNESPGDVLVERRWEMVATCFHASTVTTAHAPGTTHQHSRKPLPPGELRPGTWTRLMVAVMRLAGGPDLGILPGSGP